MKQIIKAYKPILQVYPMLMIIYYGLFWAYRQTGTEQLEGILRGCRIFTCDFGLLIFAGGYKRLALLLKATCFRRIPLRCAGVLLADAVCTPIGFLLSYPVEKALAQTPSFWWGIPLIAGGIGLSVAVMLLALQMLKQRRFLYYYIIFFAVFSACFLWSKSLEPGSLPYFLEAGMTTLIMVLFVEVGCRMLSEKEPGDNNENTCLG
ncbi:MAG: hypothetical protein IJ246_00405 [Clostridia bacterium]|nr:hypothetical protein [Clostridia bacterium]